MPRSVLEPLHWPAGAALAKVGRPSFHQFTSLGQETTTPIGRLDLVAYRVGQRGFGNLAGEARVLEHPVPEGAAEAVHGGIDLHTPQDRGEAHVRQQALRAGKQELVWLGAFGADAAQQGACWWTGRYAMFPTTLHALPRDRPETGFEVDLGPACAAHFT